MARAGIVRIELTPTDVSSLSNSVFSTLPTLDPALFGLTGADVCNVNFDTDPGGSSLASGTFLTNEYSSIGVTMNSIQISSGVFGGPASAPNATITPFTPGLGQIFTFSVPVVAVGVINTSPDMDMIQFFSGPNGTGTLLDQFIDQNGLPLNFNVDRFVGGRATNNEQIGSFVLTNNSGQIELDELIFEVASGPINDVAEPTSMALLVSGVAGLGFLRPRMRKKA